MRILEGLIFALEVENTNLKPTQVFAVVPGSPASLVASLLPGDEVSQPDSKRDCMGICYLISCLLTLKKPHLIVGVNAVPPRWLLWME